MGKVAFVFAGQGAQVTGMGRALCEASPAAEIIREMFNEAEALLKGAAQWVK